MEIYETITLTVIGLGLLSIVIGLTVFKTRQVMREDEKAMDDESFQKQISLINEKIVEMNDYHEFVQQQMEEKHKELLFLYHMIGEKEKQFQQLVQQLEAKGAQQTIQEVGVPDQRMKHDQKLKTVDMDERKAIVELVKQGLDDLTIAKQLKIGQGEVRLIRNLYH